MRKLATLFLAVAVYVLMGIGGAAAGDGASKKASKKSQKKPDSIVTCSESAGTFVVDAITTPESITLDGCAPQVESSCSPCIRSLEKQGCKVVDQDVTGRSVAAVPGGLGGPMQQVVISGGATFVLSCARP